MFVLKQKMGMGCSEEEDTFTGIVSKHTLL